MPVISFSGEKIDGFELKAIESKIIEKLPKFRPHVKNLQEIKCHFKKIHQSKIETTMKFIYSGKYESFKESGHNTRSVVDSLLSTAERVFRERKI